MRKYTVKGAGMLPNSPETTNNYHTKTSVLVLILNGHFQWKKIKNIDKETLGNSTHLIKTYKNNVIAEN